MCVFAQAFAARAPAPAHVCDMYCAEQQQLALSLLNFAIQSCTAAGTQYCPLHHLSGRAPIRVCVYVCRAGQTATGAAAAACQVRFRFRAACFYFER